MNIALKNQPNTPVINNNFRYNELKKSNSPIVENSEITFKSLPKKAKGVLSETNITKLLKDKTNPVIGSELIKPHRHDLGIGIVALFTAFGAKIASSTSGVTYESYVSNGANIEKTMINKVNRIANEAISRIINNATAESRELNELDYKRIDMIRNNQQLLIKTLNTKAKEFKKNDFIKLRDNSFVDNVFVQFGSNIENEIFMAETYKVATTERGSGFYDYKRLVKVYADKLGIEDSSKFEGLFNQKELILEAWLKTLEDVNPKSLKLVAKYESFIQNNIINRHSCNKKEYDRLKNIILHISDGEYQESLLKKLDSNLEAHQKGLDIAIKNEQIKKELLNK